MVDPLRLPGRPRPGTTTTPSWSTAENRTWAQWRGYGKVPGPRDRRRGEPQSATEYLYLRGMHGDTQPAGRHPRRVRSPTRKASPIDDHEAHAGFAARADHATTAPAARSVPATINDPWRARAHGDSGTAQGLADEHAPPCAPGTALADRRLPLDQDRRPATTHVRPADPGRRPGRRRRRSRRRPLHPHDVRPQHRRSGMVDKVPRTETVGGRLRHHGHATRPTCIVRHRTYYDGSTTFGAAPTNAATADQDRRSSTDWTAPPRSGSPPHAPRYDAHGRPTEPYDALGRTTTTAYTPSHRRPGHRPPRSTNPLGPHRRPPRRPGLGQPTGDRRRQRQRDRPQPTTALGRLTKVWLPGRDQSQRHRRTSSSPTSSATTRADRRSRHAQTTATGRRATTPSTPCSTGWLRQTQTQAPATGGRVHHRHRLRLAAAWSSATTNAVLRHGRRRHRHCRRSPDTARSRRRPSTSTTAPAGSPPTIFKVATVGEVAHHAPAYGGDRVTVDTARPAAPRPRRSSTPAAAPSSCASTTARHRPAAYDATTYTYTDRGSWPPSPTRPATSGLPLRPARPPDPATTTRTRAPPPSTYDDAGQLHDHHRRPRA